MFEFMVATSDRRKWEVSEIEIDGADHLQLGRGFVTKRPEAPSFPLNETELVWQLLHTPWLTKVRQRTRRPMCLCEALYVMCNAAG